MSLRSGISLWIGFVLGILPMSALAGYWDEPQVSNDPRAWLVENVCVDAEFDRERSRTWTQEADFNRDGNVDLVIGGQVICLHETATGIQASSPTCSSAGCTDFVWISDAAQRWRLAWFGPHRVIPRGHGEWTGNASYRWARANVSGEDKFYWRDPLAKQRNWVPPDAVLQLQFNHHFECSDREGLEIALYMPCFATFRWTGCKLEMIEQNEGRRLEWRDPPSTCTAE